MTPEKQDKLYYFGSVVRIAQEWDRVLNTLNNDFSNVEDEMIKRFIKSEIERKKEQYKKCFKKNVLLLFPDFKESEIDFLS